MLYLGKCMRVRRRTHTCFIREQPPGNSVSESFLYGHSDNTAAKSFWIEGSDKNHLECRNYHISIQKYYDHTADDIEKRHERHDFFSNRVYPADTSGYYKHYEYSNKKSGSNLWYFECRVYRRSYRVSLNDVAHKSERKYNGNGKESGKESAVKAISYVIGRSPYFFSILELYELLRYNSLRKNSSHPKESADPHPEYSARSTRNNRSCYSRKISCTNLCSYSSGKRLE